ncbi:hypothetical protein [Tumebacillus permanentifrigoris]|uniref:Uncharacterized protein n=1 Tax=Tumebacillus permanentifrigoris TaxID=378543 RepID=A0A316D4N4_9BACL|nr:hypothetical protein [Tumebacillus permanentifrigoris]PWK05268.1 hypothetical protein C7459_12417 [Tumebacillus permanentifrigoris]
MTITGVCTCGWAGPFKLRMTSAAIRTCPKCGEMVDCDRLAIITAGTAEVAAAFDPSSEPSRTMEFGKDDKTVVYEKAAAKRKRATRGAIG